MSTSAKKTDALRDCMPHEFLTRAGVPEKVATAFCTIGRFVWPSATGGVGGVAALQTTEWKHPTVTYIFISLIIQLAIELLRSAVRERRERFDAAQQQADKLAENYDKLIEKIETSFQKVVTTLEAAQSYERRAHQIYRHSFRNQLDAMVKENEL